MTRAIGGTLLALAGCNGVLGLDQTHVPPPDAPDITSGIVAYYPMDMVAPGPCLLDASGRGHDGTCMTGTPVAVPGKLGNAFQFDGATVIVVPAAPDLDPSAGFSAVLWIDIDVPPTAGCVINRQYGTTNDDTFQICLADTTIYFEIGSAQMNTSIPVPTGGWHFLGVTWDGTTAAGWLDGTQLVGQPLSSVQADTGSVTFGEDFDSGIPIAPYTGLVDEVRLFDRGLDDGQMRALAAL
jgi:hypothetical protein